MGGLGVCVVGGDPIPPCKKNTLKTPSLHRYISFDQPKVLFARVWGGGEQLSSVPPWACHSIIMLYMY